VDSQSPPNSPQQTPRVLQPGLNLESSFGELIWRAHMESHLESSFGEFFGESIWRAHLKNYFGS